MSGSWRTDTAFRSAAFGWHHFQGLRSPERLGQPGRMVPVCYFLALRLHRGRVWPQASSYLVGPRQVGLALAWPWPDRSGCKAAPCVPLPRELRGLEG